jgi:hypothetical protein
MILVAVLSVWCLVVVTSAPARSAPRVRASTPTATARVLTQVKTELLAASVASRHHHLLRPKAYRALRTGALALRKALPAATPACRTALAAIGRLPGERRHPGRLAADVRRARRGIGACVLPKTTPAPPVPTPPAPVAPTGIDGTVVDAAGRPLPGLAITVTVTTSPRGPLYGHLDFATTTGADGTFAIAQDPAAIGALAYSGQASFPWAGGVWVRDLLGAGGDAQHLVFRALLTHVTATDGSWLDEGPVARFGDFAGCTALFADPSHPVSDPATTSLTFTFEPAGPLLDGSTGATFSAVVSDPTSLCGSGASLELPAGAWFVSGVTSSGRALAFASGGGSTYSQRLEVFDGPQTVSSPLALLDIAYAP